MKKFIPIISLFLSLFVVKCSLIQNDKNKNKEIDQFLYESNQNIFTLIENSHDRPPHSFYHRISFNNNRLSLSLSVQYSYHGKSKPFLSFLYPIALFSFCSKTDNTENKLTEETGMLFLNEYFNEIQPLIQTLMQYNISQNWSKLYITKPNSNIKNILFLALLLRLDLKWDIFKRLPIPTCKKLIAIKNLVQNLSLLMNSSELCENGCRCLFIKKPSITSAIVKFVYPLLVLFLHRNNCLKTYKSYILEFEAIQAEGRDEHIKIPKVILQLDKLICYFTKDFNPSRERCQCLQRHNVESYSCKCLTCNSMR